MRLKEKIVLVTGGSGGIGSTSAILCAKEGAKAVYITYFGSPDKAGAVVHGVNESGSTGYALKADVSRKADLVQVALTIGERYGRIDAVACYAGYPIDKENWFADFLTLTEEQVSKPLDIDVRGSLFTAQAVLPWMLDQKKGSIVFISSTPGLVGDTVGITYALGKAAISNLAKCLAQVYGPQGIRVNAIAPGSIGTTANLESLSEKDHAMLAAETSLRRFGKPEEIAHGVIHLMSEESGYTTGQTLVCDGGTVFH
jgi:NAD(P)-dependent dehydrogenase (short-subunit alcohol dehydrogenase family)